jgi:hypothetical protein
VTARGARMRWSPVVVALVVGAGACGSQPLSSVTTGLTGTVVRGPVAPACQSGAPCDAPFSAGFTVLRSARPVTAFRSDDQGQFTVHLAPGSYTVVPGPDAPILSPPSQAKEVIVGPSGLTAVRLEFDTGIR